MKTAILILASILVFASCEKDWQTAEEYRKDKEIKLSLSGNSTVRIYQENELMEEINVNGNFETVIDIELCLKIQLDSTGAGVMKSVRCSYEVVSDKKINYSLWYNGENKTGISSNIELSFNGHELNIHEK